MVASTLGLAGTGLRTTVRRLGDLDLSRSWCVSLCDWPAAQNGAALTRTALMRSTIITAMTMRFVKTSVLVILVCAPVAVVNAQRGQTGAACDKACLQGIADAYLAALVAHDPSK